MPESAGPAGDYLRLHIPHTYGRGAAPAAAAARGGADTLSPAPGPRAGPPGNEKGGGPEPPPWKSRLKKGGRSPPPPRDMKKGESRPPVSGALLSHGLPPQYHRRGAA